MRTESGRCSGKAMLRGCRLSGPYVAQGSTDSGDTLTEGRPTLATLKT